MVVVAQGSSSRISLRQRKKKKANWASLWKYSNMSRILLLASNCTWSWSLNSLGSLLIRVLMNTNTWLCSTDSHIGPLCSPEASDLWCCSGSWQKHSRQEENIVLFNIQNMQAHNFWMRRVGAFSTLFLFSWRLKHSPVGPQLHSPAALSFIFNTVYIFLCRQIAHTDSEATTPQSHM